MEQLELLSPEEVRLMLHELRVHQVELEMQNEELLRVQLELQTTQAHFMDLYEMAPVGFCTLSEEGRVLQANLTAASMLGLPRNQLVKRLFTRCILSEDQDLYYLFRNQVVAPGHPNGCQLRLVKADGTEPFWVQIAGSESKEPMAATTFHMVLMRLDRLGPNQ